MKTAVQNFITPTKENPVFVVQNMYSGTCMDGGYKEWEIKTDNHVDGGLTASLTLAGAIEAAHEYVHDNYQYCNQDVRIEVQMIDGTLDRYGDPKRIKAYSISFREAKRFRII